MFKHSAKATASVTFHLNITEEARDPVYAIDNRSLADAILSDFAKAFDRIFHLKLTSKVDNIFKIPQLSYWVIYYLPGRSHFVFS